MTKRFDEWIEELYKEAKIYLFDLDEYSTAIVKSVYDGGYAPDVDALYEIVDRVDAQKIQNQRLACRTYIVSLWLPGTEQLMGYVKIQAKNSDCAMRIALAMFNTETVTFSIEKG